MKHEFPTYILESIFDDIDVNDVDLLSDDDSDAPMSSRPALSGQYENIAVIEVRTLPEKYFSSLDACNKMLSELSDTIDEVMSAHFGIFGTYDLPRIDLISSTTCDVEIKLNRNKRKNTDRCGNFDYTLFSDQYRDYYTGDSYIKLYNDEYDMSTPEVLKHLRRMNIVLCFNIKNVEKLKRINSFVSFIYYKLPNVLTKFFKKDNLGFGKVTIFNKLRDKKFEGTIIRFREKDKIVGNIKKIQRILTGKDDKEIAEEFLNVKTTRKKVADVLTYVFGVTVMKNITNVDETDTEVVVSFNGSYDITCDGYNKIEKFESEYNKKLKFNFEGKIICNRLMYFNGVSNYNSVSDIKNFKNIMSRFSEDSNFNTMGLFVRWFNINIVKFENFKKIYNNIESVDFSKFNIKNLKVNEIFVNGKSGAKFKFDYNRIKQVKVVDEYRWNTERGEYDKLKDWLNKV